MRHAKNKTDKGLITRKVALLLFSLKYSTFSFNLIQIRKVVFDTFSVLKEMNLDILKPICQISDSNKKIQNSNVHF
jgi:hypothetical protein